MEMGDVEGGPLRMARRYAIACRICGIDTQGPDFFAAIFGDDDNAMPDMDRAELIAWRRYVRENVPHSGHRTEVTALLMAALERFSRD